MLPSGLWLSQESRLQAITNTMQCRSWDSNLRRGPFFIKEVLNIAPPDKVGKSCTEKSKNADLSGPLRGIGHTQECVTITSNRLS